MDALRYSYQQEREEDRPDSSGTTDAMALSPSFSSLRHRSAEPGQTCEGGIADATIGIEND